MNISSENLKFLLLGFLAAGFIFDSILEYLNLRAQKKMMPGEVASFYDEERYFKSLEYHKVLSRFGMLTSTFSFIVTFLMILLGGFGFFDEWVRNFVSDPVLLAVVYFGVLLFLSDIISIPFQVYRTFVIEQRFEFNLTTPKTFIIDKLKGYLLGIIIGGGLLALLVWMILLLGSSFWLYFWAIAAILILFINALYTSIFVPLFNKLTPLAEGTLKKSIENYCAAVSFPLKNVFVIDGSKRSKKANAFFSGIGGRKKIVLYDTLIENHQEDELVAVLAHEVGHYKKKHIILGFITSVFQVGIMLFIMSQMIFNESLSFALGADQIGIHLNLFAFAILYSPISSLLGIITNYISRKNEYEADAYAGSTYNPHALQIALKKMSVDSLSNLFPHPAYVFVHYSHPPLLKRLDHLSKISPSVNSLG